MNGLVYNFSFIFLNYTVLMSSEYFRNYAIWYYEKYFPSVNFLRKKLQEKWASGEEIIGIFDDLSSFFQEKKIIEWRVQFFLSRGKNAKTTRQLLLQKGFEKSLIDEVLTEKKEEFSSEEYIPHILGCIKKYYEKWYSRKKAQFLLRGSFPEHSSLLSEFLHDYDEITILDKKIPELQGKGIQEWKIVSKLLSEGFSTTDIYTVLRRR